MTTAEKPLPTIERLGVAGFKSIRDPIDLELAPLTIIAGQNSAGKSTLMQPLLLMKQTMEASFQTDALLLNGTCVKVNDSATLFWSGTTKSDIFLNGR